MPGEVWLGGEGKSKCQVGSLAAECPMTPARRGFSRLWTKGRAARKRAAGAVLPVPLLRRGTKLLGTIRVGISGPHQFIFVKFISKENKASVPKPIMSPVSGPSPSHPAHPLHFPSVPH